MNNRFFYSIMTFFILFVLLSFLFGFLRIILVILLKFWYVWLILGGVLWLMSKIRKKRSEEASKDYIETEYHVEEDVKDE